MTAADGLTGEVAVVTGSTSGLGRAIAARLARDGAAVVVTGRNTERGTETVNALAPAPALFVAADLEDESSAAAIISAATERFGAVSIVVNNAIANTGGDAPVADVDSETWDRALRVNVTAAMWMCRAALPAMRAAGRGVIVNVSSRAAERASRGLAAYIASKGALNALTRSIAVDYAADGVRCNTVSPGYILHEQRDRELSADRRARLEAMHLTRLATADDIAASVAFLCSRDAECITGINLAVDGGSSIGRATSMG